MLVLISQVAHVSYITAGLGALSIVTSNARINQYISMLEREHLQDTLEA